MSSTLPASRIASDRSRSWLLVSARTPERFYAGGGADEVILDIEDAVDPSFKDAARSDVAAWLDDGAAWVRINSHDTPFWADDVAVRAASAASCWRRQSRPRRSRRPGRLSAAKPR